MLGQWEFLGNKRHFRLKSLTPNTVWLLNHTNKYQYITSKKNTLIYWRGYKTAPKNVKTALTNIPGTIKNCTKKQPKSHQQIFAPLNTGTHH